jgi:hypothetical protein
LKTPTNTKPPTTKRKLTPTMVVLSIISAIFVGYLLYIYFNSPLSPINRAAEAAAPLEAALVKAGGVKKCSLGDPGFGGDNWEPWYTGVYQLQVGRKEAIEIINTIGKENGYDFKTDKSVGDLNAEINFVDNTSKKNSYGELKDGIMYVSGIVNRYGDDHRCGGEPLVTNESQTIVRIGASLPERKK